MKKIIALFFFLMLGISFALPFRVGETMEYDVYALGWKAAHHVVRVEKMEKVNGRNAYKIYSHIRTYPFVEKFYKLDDTVYAYIDAKSFQLLKFVVHKNEGGWKDYAFGTNSVAEKKIYYYDQGKNLLTFSYKEPILDLVSMIYYGRTLDLPLHKKYTFSIVDHKKISTITTIVKSIAKKRIKVLDKKKKFQTVRIQEIGGKDVGVWFTKDERRIPFQIISMKIKIIGISLGNVKSVLKKYKQ